MSRVRFPTMDIHMNRIDRTLVVAGIWFLSAVIWIGTGISYGRLFNFILAAIYVATAVLYAVKVYRGIQAEKNDASSS